MLGVALILSLGLLQFQTLAALCQALYLKQEARFASIYLCEYDSLYRDHGGESVRSPWSGRAPHHLRTPFRRVLRAIRPEVGGHLRHVPP